MELFSALAVPTRRTIVEILAINGTLTATEIARRFSISAPAVSQHLKILVESDLLKVEKKAQQRIYGLNPKKITEVQNWAANTVSQWEHRLDALDKVLANSTDKSSKVKE